MNVNFDVNHILNVIVNNGLDFGVKLIGAILAWIVGRWLIGLAVNMAGRALARSTHIDATLQQYLRSILAGVMTVALILGILGMFGVQTTSMAALLAGAGLAIGTAWGGLLTHFAAGVFMQVLRPFKVGDTIQAGTANGTVTQIGLFTTTITTGDNVVITVGNNKIFSDNIQNFSSAPIRRVDCQVRLGNSVPLAQALLQLKQAVASLPGVLEEPEPLVQILELTLEGPRVGVRPYARNADYWNVFYAAQQAIVDTCQQHGYELAQPQAPAQPAAGTA